MKFINDYYDKIASKRVNSTINRLDNKKGYKEEILLNKKRHIKTKKK